jgi:hypothetical protein
LTVPYELLNTGLPFAVKQIEPTLTGDTVEGYLSWLTREGADACILVTSDKIIRGDFEPVVNRANMREAAEKAGFVSETEIPLPDGENVGLWKHRVMPPNCHENLSR